MFSDVLLSRGILYICLLTAAISYYLFFLLLFQSPAEFVSSAELLSLWTHVHDLQVLLNRLISLNSNMYLWVLFFSNSFLLIQICAVLSYQIGNYLHASVTFSSCPVLEMWPIPALFLLSRAPCHMASHSDSLPFLLLPCHQFVFPFLFLITSSLPH